MQDHVGLPSGQVRSGASGSHEGVAPRGLLVGVQEAASVAFEVVSEAHRAVGKALDHLRELDEGLRGVGEYEPVSPQALADMRDALAGTSLSLDVAEGLLRRLGGRS